MTLETPPSDPAAAVRWLARDDTPAGYWVRNEHFALPRTPLQADLVVTGRAMHRAFDEFAILAPAPEVVFVDGYHYGGAPQPPQAPPAERVAAFEERVHSRYEEAVLRRWREEHRPALLDELTRLTALDPRGLTDDALVPHIGTLRDLVQRSNVVHFTDGQAASLVIGRLGLFCSERLGMTAPAVIGLLAGASTASSEPTARLEDLARAASASPELYAALDAPDPWEDARVRAFVQPYLDAYGHRLLDFSLDRPTLAEQPGRAVRLLREAMARIGAAEDRDAVLARTLDETVRALRERLPTDEDRAEFERLLADARAAYGVRDDDVSFSQWAAGLLRYALLEAGRRLAGRGLLAAPDHVWYLRLAELDAALAGEHSADLAERAAVRHRERIRQEAEGPPPDVIGTPFPPAPPPQLSPAARDAVRARAWARALITTPQVGDVAGASTDLRGVAGSAGVYTGRARVTHSESGFDRIEPGDVLVCSYSSPSWTFIYGIVGAVVADEGGLLSHAAITSREYGIPCVAGAKVATRIIPDGALVTVDGNEGVVQIVDRG
jgi:pyruvate,water dikinase